MTDWTQWHEQYADPGSSLSRRLRIVQDRLREWLDATAPRPVRALSLCAGDGRDLLGVLADRGDRSRVTAVLVELDPGLATGARALAAASELTVEVRQGDAGSPELYADVAPADLLLLAGVFGNISDDDVHRTISALPLLCAPGARVIWTRHQRPPDLTPQVRSWFAEHGFAERSFTAPQGDRFSVGVHAFAGGPVSRTLPERLFSFVR
ncbi:MAG: hypothetical protein QOK15_1392 [Nocardioidaceae bacterium]|nr:hypothetical protein [Nocardioidaceae bacterium]